MRKYLILITGLSSTEREKARQMTSHGPGLSACGLSFKTMYPWAITDCLLCSSSTWILLPLFPRCRSTKLFQFRSFDFRQPPKNHCTSATRTAWMPSAFAFTNNASTVSANTSSDAHGSTRGSGANFAKYTELEYVRAFAFLALAVVEVEVLREFLNPVITLRTRPIVVRRSTRNSMVGALSRCFGSTNFACDRWWTGRSR